MNTLKMLVSLTALAAAGTSFGAIRAVTPDLYGGKPDAWQMERHAEKMEAVKAGGAEIVFVGDSITHCWEPCESWKRFMGHPYKALNLGTSGDHTDEVLGRLVIGKELDGYEAKIVFLTIGTNNNGRSPFSVDPPSDTILGIREILRVIRQKQPKAKIVLMPIFPRAKQTKFGDCVQRNAVVNNEIYKFADGENILWLDFNEQFLTTDGRLIRKFFPDQLHPAQYGYEIWYSAVKPYIDAALSDGRIPMPPSRYAPYARAEYVMTDEMPSTYPDTWIYGIECMWLDRLLENRNQIVDSDGKFDLVFLGDDAMQGWETQARDLTKDLRSKYSVLNLGYRGDRTEQILWRCMNGELEGYKAKCIMLMAGTYNTWKRKKETAESIAAGVKRILEVVAKKQPQAKVLLLPVFPVGEKADELVRTKNAKANEMIKAYADGKKVIWVDFTDKLVDEQGNNAKWMTNGGPLPTPAAYKEVWLPAVRPHFEKICGK